MKRREKLVVAGGLVGLTALFMAAVAGQRTIYRHGVDTAADRIVELSDNGATLEWEGGVTTISVQTRTYIFEIEWRDANSFQAIRIRPDGSVQFEGNFDAPVWEFWVGVGATRPDARRLMMDLLAKAIEELEGRTVEIKMDGETHLYRVEVVEDDAGD